MKFRLIVFLAIASFALAPRAGAQSSADEHAKHHAAQGQTAVPASGATQGSATSPMSSPSSPLGGMGEMGRMMEKMGTPTRKELYPSLMDLPDLPLARRAEIEQKAHDRMTAGIALLNAGVQKMAEAQGREDYAAMQDAAAQMRQGLDQYESGLAAHRALAEGKAPRNVALQWFKRDMNLLPPASAEAPHGLFGLTWFHYFVMLVLVVFAFAMIAMYFFKMRRAAILLKQLASSPPPVPPASPPAVSSSRSSEPPSGAPRPPAGAAPPSATGEALSTGVPAEVLPDTSRWSGNLRICRIFQETPEIKTFRLTNPNGASLPFTFRAGQYLNLTVQAAQKPVKRSYTIASSPTERDYIEITVKREELGIVSRYLHDRLKEGDQLAISAPYGYFTFSGAEATSIVLIGGGVGMTPLMSVIRYLTSRGWRNDIYLLYACRTSRDFVFREELEYLQKRHPNLHVVATMTRTEGTIWMGPRGYLTRELLASTVRDIGKQRVHVCGPPPMMEATRQLLTDLGVPKEQIKTEAFGTQKRAPAAPLASTAGATAPSIPAAIASGVTATPIAAKTAAVVTFSKSRKTAPMAPGKTVLEAAEDIGVDIDNSCRSGTCGTCKVKLLEGRVTMEIEDALEPQEKEQGIILACQAVSDANLTVEA